MGVEIERKFLVKDESWRQDAGEGMPCRQGYLVCDECKAVRVRRIDDRAFLTIKGASSGIVRAEFEYEIPSADADKLLELCGDAVIEKERYYISFQGMTWEVDCFSGGNAGLVVAELELEHEDQSFALPPWVGAEVSEDPRYFNASLARCPFSQWR